MTINFKKITKTTVTGTLFLMSSVLLLNVGCKKSTTNNTIITPAVASYQQVSLVANVASYGATRTDGKLQNPWGMALGATGNFWISCNHSGSTVIYDYAGVQQLAPINTPLGAAPNGASVTGVVYNNTSDFVIPNYGVGTFIYASEEGTITAWSGNTGSTTVTVADRTSAGSVYKGLAIGNDAGANFLYAADFHNGKVDVYDKNYVLITTRPFSDPSMPAGYSPFNVQNIGGQIYVTYAKKDLLGKDDVSGVGNGYVNVFSTAGVLIKRFASQGMLNSPWGVVAAPTGFGQLAGAILIGNFGDGHINVYDANGAYQAQLLKNGVVVTINGLWALTFNGTAPADPNNLYFTAGPNSEADGVFGYLKKM